MKQIHYFYKITNLINGHYYYGIRTCHCLPGKDPYMGSGIRLHKAYRKYGIENFKKEIIRVCKTREDVLRLEYDTVTDELVKDYNCYNLVRGGGEDSFYGKVRCIDKITKKHLLISKDEYHSNPDRYTCILKEFKYMINYETGDEKFVKSSEYNHYKSMNYSLKGAKGFGKGRVSVKDSTGKVLVVSLSDKRLKSGELTHLWKGRTHSDETKNKISKANSLSQKGDKNSHYGTKWMTNPEGISKPISKNLVEEYINKGWILGRKLKKIMPLQNPLKP